jgi:hypothetical protein
VSAGKLGRLTGAQRRTLVKLAAGEQHYAGIVRRKPTPTQLGPISDQCLPTLAHAVEVPLGELKALRHGAFVSSIRRPQRFGRRRRLGGESVPAGAPTHRLLACVHKSRRREKTMCAL